ncbi:MAG: radical SAM protein [Thermoprotei archaeon]
MTRDISVREVTCSSVLRRFNSYSRHRYTANFYRGCLHGCAYCYAPSLTRDERPWGSYVDVKVNSPQVLRRELAKLEKGPVFLSSASDPYQAVEAKYRITRTCLQELLRHDFPVTILTRSPLVLRDIDLFRQFSTIFVGCSISGWSGTEAEMYVPGLEARIRTLRKLSDKGITTWVSLAPLIPVKLADKLDELLIKLKEAGVKYVSPGMLRFDGYERSARNFSHFGLTEINRSDAHESLIHALRMVAEAGLSTILPVTATGAANNTLDRFLSAEP